MLAARPAQWQASNMRSGPAKTRNDAWDDELAATYDARPHLTFISDEYQAAAIATFRVTSLSFPKRSRAVRAICRPGTLCAGSRWLAEFSTGLPCAVEHFRRHSRGESMHW